MHLLTIVVGCVTVAIWLAMVFARGDFWRVHQQLLAECTESPVARVAVVIPARNEADSIGKTVQALLLQEFPGSLRVFVVDDHSTDGTADLARAAAVSISKQEMLTVIPGAPLPHGWTGKLWAVSQGVDAAQSFAPDFVLLTDADIAHGRSTVATLVAKADRESLDLTSLMVKLHCATLPEHLLIPAFVYFFLMLYPPKWIASERAKTAGAAGGCMLVRPDALAKAGGIAAIRDQVIDDCALAQAVKRAGGRVFLGLTETTHSIRPYTTFGEIERMIARTAFNQLHHSTLLLVGTVLGLLLTFVAPIALLFTPSPLGIALGALSCVLMCASYVPMVRFYGLTPAWCSTLPLAALFYLGATLDSALRYWRGVGGQWKGRAQDPAVSNGGRKDR